VAAGFDVSAGSDDQAERFNRQAAKDEGSAGGGVRCGEEHQRGDREKETGWHDQQSGEFHDRSLMSSSGLSSSAPVRVDGSAEPDEFYREKVERLYEF
jgi:hypothetical protein